MLKFEEYRPNHFVVMDECDSRLGTVSKYHTGITFDLEDFSLSANDINQIKDLMDKLKDA